MGVGLKKRVMISIAIAGLLCGFAVLILINKGNSSDSSASSSVIMPDNDINTQLLPSSDTNIPQDDLYTPFIQNFRRLYENNHNKIRIVLDAFISCGFEDESERYIYPCTEEDIANITKLAELGDHFSMAVRVLIFDPNELGGGYKWRNLAIESGEIVHTILETGRMKNLQKYDEIERLLNNVKTKDDFLIYQQKLYLYSSADDNKLCETAESAYAKFGLEVLSGFFIHRYKEKDSFFSKCGLFGGNKTREAILDELGSDEAQFIKANLLIKYGKEKASAGIFEKLYKGDNSLISINAGFCLGVMYYYGKGGYFVDQARGWELVEESMGKDFYYIYPEFDS
jgi:hypothetical protein